MRKTLIIIYFLTLVTVPAAKVPERSFIELGPKATIYIGSVRFGLGAEVIVNPLKNIGARVDLAEFSFGDGNTQFFLNYRVLSIDGLFYIPMPGLQPYIYTGFGLSADGNTRLSFRGGMGFNYALTHGTHIFIEPGAMITYNSYTEATDVWFRLSAGGRFGLVK